MTTRNTRTFSDLDMGFQAHPVSKDVSKKYDENAIKQSIKNLILTKNYERPFQSNIGSQVQNLLFEPFTPVLSAMIKRSIENTITAFEPRANLLDVSVLVSPDNNAIYVTIKFAIVNTTTPISVDLFLERTR
jgi:phage baseplate assembly protein W